MREWARVTPQTPTRRPASAIATRLMFPAGTDLHTCATCRFDADAYTDRDALATIADAAELWGDWLHAVDEPVLNLRPEPGQPSALDLLADTTTIVEWCVAGLERAEATDPAHLASRQRDRWDDDAPASLGESLVRLDRASHALADRWATLDAVHDDEPRLLGGEHVHPTAIVRHGAHAITHHLSSVARLLAGFGVESPLLTGRVAAVNVSDGGVPKRQVDQAHVGYRGLDGDVQRNRRHHGRVWQAVSLWSAEVIDGLRADGHPIGPGAAGENITVAGLDWSVLRLGTRLRIGERGPLLELTAWATPCRHLRPLFSDGDVGRISATRDRTSSRVYAKVLRDGPVGVGDRVSTVPLAPPA